MKTDRVVINASPLIVLSKVGLTELLPKLFEEIVIPDAVWKEIIVGGETDATKAAVSSLSAFRGLAVETIAPEIGTFDRRRPMAVRRNSSADIGTSERAGLRSKCLRQ